MEITNVKIRKMENGGSLMALAEVTFDDELTVCDLRLIDGKSGWFVGMPSRKGTDGKYHDLILPNRMMQDAINDAVMKAYTKDEQRRAGYDV